MKTIKVKYQDYFFDINNEKVKIYIDNGGNKYFKRKNYINCHIQEYINTKKCIISNSILDIGQGSTFEEAYCNAAKSFDIPDRLTK